MILKILCGNQTHYYESSRFNFDVISMDDFNTFDSVAEYTHYPKNSVWNVAGTTVHLAYVADKDFSVAFWNVSAFLLENGKTVDRLS